MCQLRISDAREARPEHLQGGPPRGGLWWATQLSCIQAPSQNGRLGSEGCTALQVGRQEMDRPQRGALFLLVQTRLHDTGHRAPGTRRRAQCSPAPVATETPFALEKGPSPRHSLTLAPSCPHLGSTTGGPACSAPGAFTLIAPPASCRCGLHPPSHATGSLLSLFLCPVLCPCPPDSRVPPEFPFFMPPWSP